MIPMFSNASVFEVEGARLGVVSCERCGAAIMCDPRDDKSRTQLHAEWHDAYDHAEGTDQ